MGGARLLTDDTIPLETGIPTRIVPGVHAVHVSGETAQLIGSDSVSTLQNGERAFLGLQDERIMTRRTSLGAVYILEGVDELNVPAVQRVQLSDVDAAVAVLRHTRAGSLLGGHEAARVFDNVISLVQSVPVYQLAVVRDLERLDEVVEQMLAWHRDRPSRDASVLDE
jgi:hypothetical protein